MENAMKSSLFSSAASQQGGFCDIDPVDELGHIGGAELVPLATVSNAARDWCRDQTRERSSSRRRGLATLDLERGSLCHPHSRGWRGEKYVASSAASPSRSAPART